MKTTAMIGAVVALCASTSALAAPRPLYHAVQGTIPTGAPIGAPLACLRSSLDQWKNTDGSRATPIRIAVGEIPDRTGKFSYEAAEGGSKVTQGAEAMVISSLGALGRSVRVMDRSDTKVEDAELNLANHALINDGGAYARKVVGGMIEGSDYAIHGKISGISYNFATNGAELFVDNIGLGKRIFVMNVRTDMFITDVKTYEILYTATINKQVYGQETEAGIFSFFGKSLVNLNAGGKSQEPIDLAVSAAMDRGVVELIGDVTGADWKACLPDEFPPSAAK
jgi:curli biogenesis system outer membrane secretion channel CsgG